MQAPVPQGIFVSYASQDAESAARIAAALRQAGLEVWFDQSELRGGDAWDRKLRQQIKECTLFIAVISKNTDRRLEGYFRREWKLAIERTQDMADEKAFLLPVVIDSIPDMSRHVPEKFHEVQWTHLPGGETTSDFIVRLQSLLASTPSTAPFPVRKVATTAGAESGATRSPIPPRPPAGRRRRWVLGGLATVILGTSLTGYFLRTTLALRWGGDTLGEAIIAVTQDSTPGTAAEAESLGQGIVQNLSDGLCQLPKLSVVAHEVVARLAGKPLDFARLRSELGVDKLLTVRVSQNNPAYEVRVTLVETRTLRQLWGDRFVRQSSDAAEVVESVSRAVIEALQLSLNAEDRTRLEAFRLYQRGRYYWDQRSPDGLRKAAECYGQAIRVNHDYAPAHAGLAHCFGLLPYYSGVNPTESYPKAREAAQTALELDEGLADAHAALGLVLRDYDREWARAEREFARAIELDPRYATAHQWYAEYLAALGRHEEAIRSMQRARELAPLQPIVAAVHGWVYYLARRHDDAIAVLNQTIERKPDFATAHWFLSQVYAQKGETQQAIASAETALRHSSGMTRIMAELAHHHARAGNRPLAEKFVEQLRQRSQEADYLSPYELALVEIGFDRMDQALELLNQAIRERRWEVVNLKVDPFLDPLRRHPRFAALERQMGFPN